MTTGESLYVELKSDIAALATPLFEFSETCLRKRDNFLPHAAILTDLDRVQLVAAAPNTGKDRTNSKEILPVLHGGLRLQAIELPLKALAVAEDVTVTRDGQRPSRAIKILFEHKRGLTVALYLPFEKRFLKGYVFGETFSIVAAPEVCAWRDVA
jgi:hypothetical protein